MKMAHEHEHKKLVLDYIARHGSITNHDAGRIGVGRLSARIYDTGADPRVKCDHQGVDVVFKAPVIQNDHNLIHG